MTEATDRSYQGYQLAGLVLGPSFFALLLFLPPPTGLAAAGWATAAVAVLVAMWQDWTITEPQRSHGQTRQAARGQSGFLGATAAQVQVGT